MKHPRFEIAIPRFSINAGDQRERFGGALIYSLSRATSFENSSATPLLFALVPRIYLVLSVASFIVALRCANAFLNPSLSPVGRFLRSSRSYPLAWQSRRPTVQRECRMSSRGCRYTCVRVYTRACATTETARVKVAESAGQHESTGNVSRELGVGITAASV